MRRHSLIGPFVLILIGTLFLLYNLHPDWVTFGFIATYWPFLLIAWGLLRLVEILYWELTSKPLPARGIHGGEWTLIVFIALIGSGIFAFHQHWPLLPQFSVGNRSVELFGEAYDFPVAEQRQTIKGARIVVNNLRGNTRIVGADTTEIKVGGRKTVRAYSQSQAEEANRQTGLKVVTEGDHLLIETAPENGPRDTRVSTDLELTVPRGTSIQASSRTGDFDILNIDGGVDITSSNAGVRLQDLAGSVRVDLRRSDIVRAVNVKGNVEVLGRGEDVELENIGGTATINGYYSGDVVCRNMAKPVVFQSGVTDLRFERVPGECHVSRGDITAKNVVGPVRLIAQSKDVDIQDFQGEMTISIQRGDVALKPGRAPDARIDGATRNGNVELSLPPDAKFELGATTTRGQVENEFGGGLESSTTGAGASLKGATGRGPKITLNTERGQIVLRKN
jgi:DUF4097 and DUF4098 domain-containing protein YvlB